MLTEVGISALAGDWAVITLGTVEAITADGIVHGTILGTTDGTIGDTLIIPDGMEGITHGTMDTTVVDIMNGTVIITEEADIIMTAADILPVDGEDQTMLMKVEEVLSVAIQDMQQQEHGQPTH